MIPAAATSLITLVPAFEGLSAAVVYLLVFGIVFVESGLLVGFFLPGDSILFAAGLLAAAPGASVNIWVLCIGVFIAAFVGDQVGYWTGRKLGRPYLDRKAASPKMAERLAKTERYYERYGPLSIIVARFIPWVRTFTPIVAGIGMMDYRRFMLANLAGSVIWGIGMTYLGYVCYAIPWLKNTAVGVAMFFIVGSIALSVFATIRERRASRSGDNLAG